MARKPRKDINGIGIVDRGKTSMESGRKKRDFYAPSCAEEYPFRVLPSNKGKHLVKFAPFVETERKTSSTGGTNAENGMNLGKKEVH